MEHDLRIGDVERDDATRLLQDHLAAGRLDHEEFTRRMDGALRATHTSHLEELFCDLPGRRPGAVEHVQMAPVATHPSRGLPLRPPLVLGGIGLVSMMTAASVAHAALEPHGHLGRHGDLGPGGQMAHHGFAAFPFLMLVFMAAALSFLVARRVVRTRRRWARAGR